nr:zinc ABC transporter substrate-binding protein [Ketogulonicigenium vulgare]
MPRWLHSTAICTVITFLSVTSTQAAPLQVVATFSIIGDMAGEVGGDLVDLKTLVAPDADAHVYEPRPPMRWQSRARMSC